VNGELPITNYFQDTASSIIRLQFIVHTSQLLLPSPPYAKMLLMSYRQVINIFKQQFGFLPLILLAGFALRLYRLGADSLWYDETVSAYLASESIPHLIAHTARDIHPPGYYVLLHLWTRAAGLSEFALAFFSLIFGLLLIPLTFALAKQVADTGMGSWAALLVAISPYHLWYSQEVRMYTLGAALGLVMTYFGLKAVTALPVVARRQLYLLWLLYLISATVGLYTLYYFAFLLAAINGILLSFVLLPTLKQVKLGELVLVNLLILVAYLPWLPLAWQQATHPPVPPWRTAADISLGAVVLESWSALALGQSVEAVTVWPLLLLTLVLFILGLFYLTRSPAILLSVYCFGPLLLIYLFSLITPLFHVRYLFIYSPAFYIVLAAGLVALARRFRFWTAMVAAGLLLVAALFSIYRFHFDPRYRADDYRAAVRFIQEQWQPGDVILVNAGYVYPAFLYYTNLPNLEPRRLTPYQTPVETNQPLLLQTGAVDGSPQLGWGNPRSDFYAMRAEDTVAALEALSQDFARLWLLRAYDTVTDPAGLIRTWLAQHTTPLEDQLFSGESSIRAQGFLLAGAPSPPKNQPLVQFADGMTLAGFTLPDQTWQAGQTIPVKLWWMARDRPSVDYKMSLKLWQPDGELAAQGHDNWPIGTLYRATAWPGGQVVYQPAQLTLPANLAVGQYWLNVELYHPETRQPLARLDGADPVVTLGLVRVGN
jgi:uncharacterized membrane protein